MPHPTNKLRGNRSRLPSSRLPMFLSGLHSYGEIQLADIKANCRAMFGDLASQPARLTSGQSIWTSAYAACLAPHLLVSAIGLASPVRRPLIGSCFSFANLPRTQPYRLATVCSWLSLSCSLSLFQLQNWQYGSYARYRPAPRPSCWKVGSVPPKHHGASLGRPSHSAVD